MPSPVGHSLASVAVAWAVAGPATPPRAFWIQTAVVVALGNAPDLDFLIGRHSGETHSVGAAAIAACLAAWWRWPIAPTRGRIWLAAFLVWASHPLLDSLAPDNRPPIGVMMFWPFTTAYFHTGLAIFAPISRRYWLPGFVWRNIGAVLREAAILLPVCGIVWWFRRVRGASP